MVLSIHPAGFASVIKIGDFLTDDLSEPIFGNGNSSQSGYLVLQVIQTVRQNITGMTTSGTSKFYENRVVVLQVRL